MDKTIDIIRSKINNQIQEAIDFALIYDETAVPKFKEIHDVFTLNSFDIVKPAELVQKVHELNIEGQLMDVMRSLRNSMNISEYDEVCARIKKLSVANNIDISTQSRIMTCISLNCGGKMEVIAKDSQIRCTKCAMIMDLEGTIHANTGGGGGELSGSRKNNNSSNSKSHEYQTTFLKCYKEITGQIPCTLEPEKEAELRRIVSADKRLRIGCKDMRINLRQCGLSKYNNRVPYFLKEYAKMDLVIFTPEEYQIFQMYFIHICTIIEEIKTSILNDRRNNINRNFIFYKIAQNFITDLEKLELIENLIPFPNQATLIKYDLAMKHVCVEMERLGFNFPYRATPMRVLP